MINSNFYETWEKLEHYGHPIYCDNIFYNESRTLYDDFIESGISNYVIPLMNREFEVYQFENKGKNMFIYFLFSNAYCEDSFNTIVFDCIPVDLDFNRMFIDAGKQRRGLPPLLPESKLHKSYREWCEVVQQKKIEKERNEIHSRSNLEDIIMPEKKNPYYPFSDSYQRYLSFSNTVLLYWPGYSNVDEIVNSADHSDLTDEEYRYIKSIINIE